MKILKNKMLLLAPIAAFIITFIFALTQFPTAKQSPKNLPIAIVNEDTGVDLPNGEHKNLGEDIIKNIKTASITEGDEEPAVKWGTVSSIDELKERMDKQEYYGAIIIPKDFSEKQATLQTAKPSSPEIQIYVNQGMNATVSTMVTTMLTGMVDTLNANMSQQLLEGYEEQGTSLTIEQASVLNSPITKTVTNVNETGSLVGTAPISFFQPLWMASLIGAVLLFLSMRKLELSNKKEKLSKISVQVVMGALIAVVAGFGLTWVETGMNGFDIPNFIDTAVFLSITSFSFLLMILAVLSWLGLAAMPIFVLLLFFGAPLLSMAPEMMPSFYANWIHPWFPMRFLVDGLRDLFFFDKELSWNEPTSVLVWIGVGSLIVLGLSSLKKGSQRNKVVTEQSGM